MTTLLPSSNSSSSTGPLRLHSMSVPLASMAFSILASRASVSLLNSLSFMMVSAVWDGERTYRMLRGGCGASRAAKLAALLYNLALFNHAEGAAMRMPEIVTIVVILLITILMQGCGRKGPLFLEQMPAPVVVAPAQPASAPVVAPAASSVPA